MFPKTEWQKKVYKSVRIDLKTGNVIYLCTIWKNHFAIPEGAACLTISTIKLQKKQGLYRAKVWRAFFVVWRVLNRLAAVYDKINSPNWNKGRKFTVLNGHSADFIYIFSKYGVFAMVSVQWIETIKGLPIGSLDLREI